MKNSLKIAKVALALVLCICLTGCSSKETKLVCKQEASGVNVTLNTLFKGNIVSSMDVLYEMDLSSYSDLQIEAIEKQDFCSKVKTAMSSYGEGFENCKQDILEKKLTVSADLNISKFSDNVLDTIGSPKITKTSLETQGYSCTLE